MRAIFLGERAGGRPSGGRGLGFEGDQRSSRRKGSVDTLLRFSQFRLDHAPSLFQGSHLSFRRGDDLLRERCEQRLKPLVSVDRKHPVVLPIVLVSIGVELGPRG